MLQAAAITALSLAVIYIAIGAGMYVEQRRLLYFPDQRRFSPEMAGLHNVTEETIATPDHQQILAWYGRAAAGQPTLLYFHGNGGSLINRGGRIEKYLSRGRGVFMMTYRGYGGSTGTPTEVDNVADAKLAYDTLVKSGVRPDDIIIYGESLGTGVAVQVAADKSAAGLILDAPYTSITDRAAELYPWLPVRTLLKDRYDSMSYIGKIKTPLLVVHGEKDDMVPIALGRKLFAAAPEPKEFAAFALAGHENHTDFGSFEVINAWIDRVRSGEIKR